MLNRRPPFDDETMKEIGQARARLDAYMVKGLPYPALEEEPESDIEMRLTDLEARQGEPIQVISSYHVVREKTKKQYQPVKE